MSRCITFIVSSILFFSIASANEIIEKRANNIAQSSKVFILNFAIDELYKKIDIDMQTPYIQGIIIYDHFAKESIISAFKDDKSVIVHKKAFPEKVKKLPQISVNIVHEKSYDKTTLATLLIYYDPVILTNMINLRKEVNLTQEERAFLDKNPILKVYMDYAYPPYSFLEDGKLKGFSVEYLNFLSRLLGINIEYVHDLTWQEALKSLQEKKIDIIGQMVNTKHRREFTLFTENYYNYFTGILTKHSNKNLTSLEDFEGKTVGLVKGYYQEKLLQEHYPKIKIKLYQDTNRLITALLDDEFDATILTYQVLEFMMKKRGLEDRLINIPMRVEPILGITKEAFGVRKDWELLRSSLNKVINLTAGERYKIEQKWLLSEAVKEKNTLLLDAKEKSYLDEKEYITFCSDPQWEPYVIIDELGEHKGLSEDFITLIEKKIDKKFVFVPTSSWEESLEYIKQKKCEIIPLLNQSKSREKYLNFSPSLYEEPEVILARDEVTYLDGYSSLQGQSVALVKGHKVDEHIKANYPKINIVYVKNYEEAINLVSEGEVFATVNSLIGTSHLIKKTHLTNVKIAGKTDYQNSYRVGVIKEDTTLHTIITKAVDSLKKQDRDNVIKRWVSITFEQGFDYSLIKKIVLLFGFILVFVYFRQRSIKKQNLLLQQKVEEEIQKSRDKDSLIFHQNKLVAMGEMIEDIAHQWRQPLSEINSLVLNIDDTLCEKALQNKNIEEKLNRIEILTKYMSTTIDDFRSFFNPIKKEESFTIKEAIEGTLLIVEKSLGKLGIEIDVQCASATEYKGHKNALQQVLLIIINNAKDEFMRREIKNPKITIEIKSSKEYYQISISDNAGGIEDSVMQHIFTPYFTTKDEHKGTGLGLYIARSIIEDILSGKLSFSNIDKGVCFTIKLKRIKNG